jgi:ArsR family transcriptional regulator
MENLEKLALVFKALSDSTRLRIVKMLSQHYKPICVNGLTNRLDISQSAVSQHLRVLKQAGLVSGERRGNFIHYTLNQADIEAIRSRLVDSQGDDFLVISNEGPICFGADFWDRNNQIKALEDHLSTLQNKTSEIESLIRRLKKEDS